MEQAIRTGGLHSHAYPVAWLSEAYLRAGRLEEAWQHAARRSTSPVQHKERGNEALGPAPPRRIVHPSRSPGGRRQAEAYYRQALALADELGMRPLLAHCHRGLGTLYAKIGRREQARAELSTAIELYRAMDMTFWLPEAEAALAQVEGR